MSASEKLSGLTLPDGWRVTAKKIRPPFSSGGTFSSAYDVERGKQRAFLKAFDFSDAFSPGVDTVSRINILTSGYIHEREILAHCGEKRMSKVVLAIGHGFIDVPGYSGLEARVYYLIFENAEQGDIRCQIDLDKKFGPEKCADALKDVSVGLRQIHKERIAHQDGKPSNVLDFGSAGFKIADFGRSSWQGKPIYYDDFKFPGDHSYAPPEFMYGMIESDFTVRRIGTDLYMLGNLAAFLFSGVNMSAHLLTNLDPVYHPGTWAGSYDEVLPYLRRAYADVLSEVAPLVDERIRADLISIISQLCEPDPKLRGHPKGLGTTSQYSLERYVTRMDRFAKLLRVRAPRLRAA